MTGIPSYSTTPANNVAAKTGITWDEGMSPALVNNSARQNMTDMRLAFNDASWFQYGAGTEITTTLPAYASATTFTIAGIDVTSYWHVGRRVKAVGSSTGTIYGKISVTAFSTNTTVTVVWDSGSLSNETLAIYAGTQQVTGKPVAAESLSGTATSLTFVTPTLGAATGTSLALGGATLGANTLAITGTSAASGLITAAGGVSSTLVTDATSATTGSIITAGGISAQKSLYIGGASITLAPASGSSYIYSSRATQSTGQVAFQLSGGTSGTDWIIYQPTSSNNLTFFGNSADRMTLTSAGLLGIGMTPSNVLDITQTQNADSIVKLLNSSSGAAATGTLQLSNNIGASAIYRMHGGSFTTAGIYRQDGALLWANGAGGMTVGTGAAQPLYFVINSGAAGQFNASGHLCINTTTDQGHLNVGGAVTALAGGTANTASCVSMDFSGGVGRIQGYGPDASTNGSLSFSSCRSNGSNAFVMTYSTTGGLSIPGALSKGSGSFRIDHPVPALTETHQLVHSFIEGPKADLIYRGKVELVAGTASINIDTASTMTEGTFVILCRDVQCFTTNESDWTPVKGSVSGNIITIEAQDDTSTATISWMVIGERQDKHIMETEWTDEDGRVIVEPLKPVDATVTEETAEIALETK